MLNEPKTLERKQHGDAGKRDADGDSSSEFIHELAESGTASELGTVKAASDAAGKEEDRTSGKASRTGKKRARRH